MCYHMLLLCYNTCFFKMDKDHVNVIISTDHIKDINDQRATSCYHRKFMNLGYLYFFISTILKCNRLGLSDVTEGTVHDR